MYCLTRNGQPISKPHPHRVTCYIEALERGLVKRGAGRYWFCGVKITTAAALNDFVADVAKRNGIGCATIQIVPVDRDTFNKQPGFISGGKFLNQ